MPNRRGYPALLIILAAAGALASCAGGAQGAMIGPQEAFELVQRGDALLVDVRNEASYYEAHLAGAVLVPLAEVASRAQWLESQNRTIIFYCSCPAEETSTAAAATLISLGGADVRVLKGGIRDWSVAGLPLKSGARP